jgi:hypothetical protein
MAHYKFKICKYTAKADSWNGVLKQSTTICYARTW